MAVSADFGNSPGCVVRSQTDGYDYGCRHYHRAGKAILISSFLLLATDGPRDLNTLVLDEVLRSGSSLSNSARRRKTAAP